MSERDPNVTRRDVMARTIRIAAVVAAGGGVAALAAKRASAETVWQIDPYKCVWCGKCATNCVLKPSAVKCVQNYQICGYCKLCTGYNLAQPLEIDEAAENQICPTGAIVRKRVEGEYYSYDIIADKCIGCAKCVKGCTLYGNGSFFLQIDHKLCVDCNRCSIAAECPSQAISRVALKTPYKIRTTMRSDS